MNNDRNKIYIAPSIFAGDFGFLNQEACRIKDAGADAIHFDIMDGHFVQNLSLSPTSLAAVNRATDLYLDVHIMVYRPFDYIEELVRLGADCITFHIEATEEVEEVLKYIRKCGVHAGLAFCPETEESLVVKYLDKCDKMLFMTVHPGFGGQALIPKVLEKVKFTRDLCNRLHIRKGGVTPGNGEELPPFDIQVDGGVNAETALLCIQAGANHLVAGSYLFHENQMEERIKGLRG